MERGGAHGVETKGPSQEVKWARAKPAAVAARGRRGDEGVQMDDADGQNGLLNEHIIYLEGKMFV